MKNKLIIASAWSWKTTFLVEEALKEKEWKILITTYTEANEEEIRKKIIEKNKCIPSNVTVQSWFSFLLQHGVKPFQPYLYSKKINGLTLVNWQSGFRTLNGKLITFSETKNFEKYYFTKDSKIYSDKLSKFVYRCNEKTEGNVINRIERIYSHIFIDEVQDLAGYDLNLLLLLFKSSINTLLVGDPRQWTYSTNHSPKNAKYRTKNIIVFLEQQKALLSINKTLLNVNYRCNQKICDISDQLFPNLPRAISGNKIVDSHSWIFFIKKKDINRYLWEFCPMQLRNDKSVKIDNDYPVMTYWSVKWLSFDRVLIYPTKPILEWIRHNKPLADISCAKLYVALTRARHSVAIVYDFNDNDHFEHISKFNF